MKASIVFVRKLQTEIAKTIFSINESNRNLLEFRIFHYCRFINNCLHSFLVLQESNEQDSGKILLRTALEVSFRLEALRKRPDLLVRIARWEHNEDSKAANSLEPKQLESTKRLMENRWKDFTDYCSEEGIDVPDAIHPLDANAAADMCGLSLAYNVHYRVYSRFSHGAISALRGDWDDYGDDPFVASYCLMVAMAALENLGGHCPNKGAFELEFLSFC